jgi:hypothetical protein
MIRVEVVLTRKRGNILRPDSLINSIGQRKQVGQLMLKTTFKEHHLILSEAAEEEAHIRPSFKEASELAWEDQSKTSNQA